MNGLALVFPGQGSQTLGMGRRLYQEFPAAREVFEEASEAAGLDLKKLCFEGPADKLELTEFTQPCLLAASLAAHRVLDKETGLRPMVAAGHSLGEWSALAAAGALKLADAAAAVHERGKWMDRAVPAGLGAMAAVMKLPREQIEQACRSAARGEVAAPANDNAPDQVVISGHAGAVARALEMIKQMGGRTRMLKVSGPFHTLLMKPAADRMDELLAGIHCSGFSFPVIANVDARAYPGPDRIRRGLVAQMTSPVRWRESVEEMAGRGAELFIEVGPGRVLAGLIQRILPGARVFSMSEPEDLNEIKAAIS